MSALDLASLADRPIWVAWRNEMRGGKPTKVPYGGGGRKAKADDAATWLTREKAEALAAKIVNGSGGGVGIEFGAIDAEHRLGGIDLDTCRNPESGAIELWAREVIERIGSYAEVSPSGGGAKVYFRWQVSGLDALRQAMRTEHGRAWKRGGGEHPPAIELHLGNRYFAVTSEHLDGTPTELRTVPLDVLMWLIREGGPRFAGVGKRGKSSSTDSSRSATAMRLGAGLRREGKTFEAMVDVLRTDPETAEWYRTKGEASDGRELRRIWERAGQQSEQGVPFSEDFLALAFSARHDGALLYVPAWSHWLRWDGVRWARDDVLHAFDAARAVCREYATTAEDGARKLAAAATVAAVERLARCDPRHARSAEVFDRDPLALNTPGGVVDLRTGNMRERCSDDLFTKATAIAPAKRADCPRWRQFIAEITLNDADAGAFLQRAIGYSLTGDIREHGFFFLHGPGGNGKGVLLGTIGDMLGDYSTAALPSVVTASPTDQHPTHIAALRGARFVTVSEVEEGRPWAENQIKSLTGGDRISARVMRGDPFEFSPAFKLWVAGNHRPVLRNPDPAMRRRMHLVPMTYVPAVPDLALPEKLRAELPGILRWTIDGCLAWQHQGLDPPEAIREATDSYFAEQDSIAAWIAERTERQRGAELGSRMAFLDWKQWAIGRGEEPGTEKRFSGEVERHAAKRKLPRGVVFLDLRLLSTEAGAWNG